MLHGQLSCDLHACASGWVESTRVETDNPGLPRGLPRILCASFELNAEDT